MKITIESTEKVVTLKTKRDGAECCARVWEGYTASGIPVLCFVTRIAVRGDADNRQFERELQEQRAPSAEVRAIPLRLIL